MAVPGRTNCLKCAEDHANKSKARRAYYKSIGVCCCGQEPIDKIDENDKESALCIKCKNRLILTRVGLKEVGKCIDSCGRFTEGSSRCDVCLKKQNVVYHERKANGLCHRCGARPPTDFHDYCGACLEYGKNRIKEQVALATELGICTKCFGEKELGFESHYCVTCFNLNLEYQDDLKSATNCPKCGQSKEDLDAYACVECLEMQLNAKRKRTDERIQQGICPRGCGNQILKVCDSCEICWYKDKAAAHLGDTKRWEELKQLLIKQNSKCALTGETLVIGYNACLDHMVPKCRDGAINDISNLHWVSLYVNMLKGNLLLNEFKSLLPYFNEVVQKAASLNSVTLECDANSFKELESVYLAVNKEIFRGRRMDSTLAKTS